MDIMANKKTQFTKPFAAATDFYMRVQGWTNKDMGRAVGYKDGKMLSAIRTERTNGSEEMRRTIAGKLGFSLDELLKKGKAIVEEENLATLDSELPSFSIQAQSKEPENDIQRYKSLKNAKHHEIVDKFRHSNLAEKINHLLLELDQKGGERWLKRVERYVKAELEDLSEEEESKTGSGDDPSGERKGA